GTFYLIGFQDVLCTTGSFATCNTLNWSNTTVLPPPPNDDPCSAIALNSASSCNYTTYTNANATATAGVTAPGCAGYNGGDVWFSVVIPPSGNLVIDTQAGAIVDGGMAIYSGTCGSLTLIECDDDDSQNGAMPSISVTAGTPGQTLFVRVWDVGNNNNGTFGICAVESSACGTPLSDDYCESPTMLYQGPNNFSSATTGYTSDIPGNLGMNFCGSIENNSWFSFIASNTTETFNFISITNCINNPAIGTGIQAAVYQVTPDVNGCCSVLNLVSNCYSSSTATPGIVTATPLTVGNQYILVVDGFSGDQCDFTLANWSTTMLPVELSDFYVLDLGNHNALRWETDSEKDNDYFNVLRSFDGLEFERISQLSGAGDSEEKNFYRYDDTDVRSGTVYYQLEQVDFNGDREKSEIVAINRESDHEGLITVYPNPSTAEITAEINGNKGRSGLISITNIHGVVTHEQEIFTSGIKKYKFDLNNCFPGVYFVRYQDDNSSRTVKLIKQ
ncbi:MAG: T9SS type A sorting domain-containing protein, partial [Crocinitomicaceae bacterium]